MERDCHNAIGGVESFFHTVTMVDVDIDVENALLKPEELDDAENNVCKLRTQVSICLQRVRKVLGRGLTVHITKPASFALLRVMQASRPVDGDIALPSIQPCSTLHTATCANSAELKQAIEDWAIVTNIVFALLLGEVVHVIRSDFLEEVDVFVRMELCHFEFGGWFCAL